MALQSCDVLIVGAGPVGLLLALLLQQHHIDVVVVERQKSIYPLPRAVAFDHESRRLFGLAGLREELDAILENVIGVGGEHGTNFVWRDAELKLIADLFTEAPTSSGYPFWMAFNQPSVERLLEKQALARGVRMIKGFALCDLTQSKDSVVGEFEQVIGKEMSPSHTNGHANGHQTNGHHTNGNSSNGGATLSIAARYVVGCDGANSTVRRLGDFTTTDLNFENDWLVLDLMLRDGYIPPIVQKLGSAQICDPNRPTTVVFGGEGRKRFEFMRLPTESKDELLEVTKIWELLEPWGFNQGNCSLERKVIYTFKARWANEFYKGRVILAGDALHLMPPFIGQGLNSGFRDVGALAWRLPLILSGVADPSKVLQSYQVERLDHIKKLTTHCIALGQIICETDAEKARQMHADVRGKPPNKIYDPPLGRPGIMTDQKESGHLSLQRRLKVESSSEPRWFDDVHGYGWRLLSFDADIESCLSPSSKTFFSQQLGGICVNVPEHADLSGEYRKWFEDELGSDHVVLVRPDFYVFGHVHRSQLDCLLDDLRSRLGVKEVNA